MNETAPMPAVESVLAQETGAGRYQVLARAGRNTFFVDEPVSLGGKGSGPNPYDLLGAALAACSTMTVRFYADRKGWSLNHVSVRVSHHRATLQARDRFDRQLMIEGDLDDDQRAKLLEIANRCPVHLTLERGADVFTEIVPPSLHNGMEAASHALHLNHVMQSSIALQEPGG